MAQSYQLIVAVTVGSGGAAEIEFASIPSTYTDLKLVHSTRGSQAGYHTQGIRLTVNGTTSGYTTRILGSDGLNAVAATNPYSVTSASISTFGAGADSTANTFGNSEIYIPNYAGSNNKSISTDSVTENNNTVSIYKTQMYFGAVVLSNTAAITSIKIAPETGEGNFVQYSTAYLYGIGGARASGGTITADGNYTYHTFTSTGTFTALERIRGAEALVIAGGGGGSHAGGGGAGGLRVVPGLLLPAGNTYTVTVGSGGAGAGTTPTKGSDSVFSTITSEGGGVGKYLSGGTDGGNGGSGGGAGSDSGASARTGGVATSGQGNNGGNYTPTGNAGGGGGGAGAVGTANSSSTGGSGGVGSASYSAWGYATSTGQNVGNTYYYAGGGGAGGTTAGGSAGSGGGGAGSTGTGTAGTANTGGGGGGGWGTLGATGGSGVVIIRYPNS
jgi:hypothetical protein